MKKLLICLLVLIMCVAGLVACGGEETTAPGTTVAPSTTTAPTTTENTGLQDAKAYLEALYKDAGESTPVDYELIGALRVAGVPFTLEWSVGDVTGVTVTRKDATTVTVDVIDRAEADIPYTLTATITDAEGKTIKVEFQRKVPKFKENTFAEYAAAEKGDLLIVKGVVSGIIAKSKGNTANCLYVQDVDGGYYVYGLAQDPVTELHVELGMTVRVTGTMDIYNGTFELKDASVEILNDGAKTDVVAKDLTDAFKAASDLKAKELVGIQGMYVTLKGVTIGELGDNGYHYFTLGGHKTYVRISSSTCPLTKEEQTAFTASWSSHLGWTADIAGVISLYDGKFYLTPCVPTDVEFKSLPELDDAGKVAFEKGNVTLVDKIKDAGEITIPTAGTTYTGVTITWSSDNACITVNGGKLVVTLPTADTTVKVTATLKSGDATDTVEFEVKVVAPATVVYKPELVQNPVAGTAYKFAMTISGKTYFYTGKMTDDNKYLATSEDAADAVDVYIETVDGGVRFYIMNGEAKSYIDLALREDNNQKANIVMTATPAAVWTYDATNNIFTAKLGENSFFLGTYGTYTTISVSSTYYITGDKAGDIDVSQYPARFYTMKAEAAVEKVPTVVNPPVADKAYKFALAVGDKIYYFTGAIANQYYLATSEDVADAVDVFIENVTGGVRFYFMDGTTKTYIDVVLRDDVTKANIVLTATPAAVFTYNAKYNNYVATLGENTFYLGTYGTHTTVSVSNTTYINDTNVDVSQYPARFYELVAAETPDTPVVPDEPTVETDPSLNDAPIAKLPYKVALTQVNLGKVLYLTGAVNGRALATTDDAALAAEFYLEAAEGGYLFATYNGTKKVYINLTINKKGQTVLTYAEEGTVFTYNAVLKAWMATVDGAKYFLGTTTMYGDVYASLASFLTTETTGVKQFTAVLAPTDGVADLKAGTLYKFGLYQANLGKMIYVTGKVDGRYLATTDKIEEAANVFAEKATDGYKFFLFDGKDKKYLDVYFNADNKLSVQFATAGDVFSYDAATKAWTTTVDDVTYYVGAYNSFNTISASKTSYITAENTGVSQFPCTVYSLKNDGPVAVTLPEFKAIAATLASGASTTEKYIITGVVSNVYNTTYGNMYVKDENGVEVTIYGCYDEKGVRYDKMTDKPKAGDTVTFVAAANNYNGTEQMKNATLTGLVKAPKPTYTTPTEIVNAAYALEQGESLGNYTLTGIITLVDTPYDTGYKNVTVTFVVAGLTDKPIKAFRLKGTGADKIGVGDEITVTGEIVNYYGTIEFNSGCTLDSWVDNPEPEAPEAPETPDVPVDGTVFDFGTDKAGGTHTDNSTAVASTFTVTENGKKLTFTNTSKVYDKCFDKSGKACLKLGTGSAVGKFTITVDADVNKVVFYVAKYKNNGTVVSINGTNYTITTASDNGEYTAIEIDTTTNKTINFATTSSGKRCTIDKIVLG